MKTDKEWTKRIVGELMRQTGGEHNPTFTRIIGQELKQARDEAEAQGGIEALEWAVNVAESEFTSRRATGCGINGVASVIETIRAEIERRKTERSRRNGVLFCKRDAQSS